MSKIQVSNLTFAYDGSYDNIFEQVSFQIDTNWKLGFTGRNGRGKTTFLSLLMGKYEYSGSICADVVFDYFPYIVTDETKDTAEIAEEINPNYEYWELQKEIYQLGLSDEVLYRAFNTLSYGERTKLMLAVLFLQENHFLLIDEPTNHLDMEGRQLLGEYLKRKSGFVLVSHDRSFLDECTDHTLAINKTNIEVQKGNFSSWFFNWEQKNNFEQKENEKLKKEIGILQQSAKQARGWADEVESRKIGKKGNQMYEKNIDRRAYIGEKSRRMQQRRKNLEGRQKKAIEEKSSLLKNIEYKEALKLSPLPYPKDTLVQCRNLVLFYEQKQVNKPISFEIKRGERIALQGKNGCGKSTVLKRILGEKIAYNGALEVGSGLKISYVSQDTSFLSGNLTDFAIEHKLDETLFKTILRKLDFSRVQFEKNMEQYSAGQKKKVLISKSLCEQAHLYIWDEPLNYIDVFSRMQIEELLLSCGATLIFVEHDKKFTENIATKTVLIQGEWIKPL